MSKGGVILTLHLETAFNKKVMVTDDFKDSGRNRVVVSENSEYLKNYKLPYIFITLPLDTQNGVA